MTSSSLKEEGLFDKYLQKLDPLVKNKFMGGSHMHPATPGKEGNRLIIMVNAIVLLLISLMPVDEQPLFHFVLILLVYHQRDNR